MVENTPHGVNKLLFAQTYKFVRHTSIFRDIYSIWQDVEQLTMKESSRNKVNFYEELLIYQKLLAFICSSSLSFVRTSQNEKEKYYWNIHPDHKERVSEYCLDDAITLKLGPLKSLSPSLLAGLTDVMTSIYSNELLKIKETSENLFPSNIELNRFFYIQKNIQLLLAMAKSFRPNSLIAIAVGKHEGQEYILGSIGALPGFGPQILQTSIGSPASSIPTHTSLRYELFPEAQQFLAQTREEETVEITRLFSTPQSMLPTGVFQTANIGRVLVCSIHQAIKQYLPEVTMEVFNTKRELNIMMRRMGFPIQILGRDVRPTKSILETIHAMYFRQIDEKHLDILPQAIKVEEAHQVGIQHLQKLLKENQS